MARTITRFEEFWKQEREQLPVKRLVFAKGYFAAIDDESVRRVFERQYIAVNQTGVFPERQIVVLLHGMNTHAPWLGVAERELGKLPNTIPIPVGFGFFDPVRFLLAYFFHRGPVSQVRRGLEVIRQSYPNDKVAVVAHSFGTYVLARVLMIDKDIRINRVLLCGAIVRREYDWSDHAVGLGRECIVNEVGAKDIWPLLARSATWYYGASGTFGFRRADICDRFHDLGHSDFFTDAHIRKYWVPFLADGRFVDSGFDMPKPEFWKSWLDVCACSAWLFVGSVALACFAIYHVAHSFFVD